MIRGYSEMNGRLRRLSLVSVDFEVTERTEAQSGWASRAVSVGVVQGSALDRELDVSTSRVVEDTLSRDGEV